MQLEPITAPQVSPDFHAKLRTRFLNKLKEATAQNEEFSSSVSLWKGIPTVHKNYEDFDYLPEQESTFWYLFGVKEADCYAVIQHGTGKAILFVPFLDQAYKLWMTVKTQQELKAEYGVDEVRFVQKLREYLEEVKPSTIYIFTGLDSDSKRYVSEPDSELTKGFKTDREILWPLISNLRAIKTPEQIELLRYVCKVTTEAEIIAAQSAKPGLLQNQLQSVFHFQHAVKTGCPQLGFNLIASSGCDCATLHYELNDKVIQPNQMVLLDMGGKWHGYVADQAMTFPVSGKFDQKQKEIYTAVLEAQKAVKNTIKPGVKWDQMHLLAEKVILEHLIKLGIVNNAPMEELVQHRIGAIFFPHGLGHLFGLKVHDLGGYTTGPARSQKEGLNKLRMRRELQQGMCITVEPGCYFIDFKIEKSLNDPVKGKYLNKQKLEEYKYVGGVRLQDDVVITKDGYEMLSFLPRQIEDVEKMLAQKK